MSIELDDKSYIVGIWFSYDPITNNDWLACIIKDPERPETYKCWSRFRYAKDNKIWGSDDEKSWTIFTSGEGKTDEDMIRFMELTQNLESAYKEKDKIIVQGDIKKLVELAKDKSWMNIKQVKAPHDEL